MLSACCSSKAIQRMTCFAGVERCNCSICAKNGFLHWEVESRAFELLTPEQNARDYQFGTHTSHNYFCARCGISSYRRSRTAPDKIDVNVRCLEGVDVDGLEIGLFDGMNWELEARRRGLDSDD